MSYPQGPQGPQYGGYPQSGAFPQQPQGYPQQGGYPAQGGYPQQGGGYPPGFPPPKKNNTAIIATVVGVALAAVVALVLVLTLSGDDDPKDTASGRALDAGPVATVPGPNKPGGGGSRPTSGGSSGGVSGSPQELAEKAAEIIESRSTSQIDALACTSSAASQLKRELSKVPAGASATVDDVSESGNQAQAKITVKVGAQSEGITMEMAKSGTKWCAAGI